MKVHASLVMHYELAKDFVVLTGNAYLQQVDSNIKGDGRSLPVKRAENAGLSATKGKRVTTVLVPSQLQDKTTKGDPGTEEG